MNPLCIAVLTPVLGSSTCTCISSSITVPLQMRRTRSWPLRHWKNLIGVWTSWRRCRHVTRSARWLPIRYHLSVYVQNCILYFPYRCLNVFLNTWIAAIGQLAVFFYAAIGTPLCTPFYGAVWIFLNFVGKNFFILSTV